MLLALRLQRAGLSFISAKAVHRLSGAATEEFIYRTAPGPEESRILEIVCPTQQDADKVDAWALSEGLFVQARVATEQELADHKRFEELL